jgi:hypothetical protein
MDSSDTVPTSPSKTDRLWWLPFLLIPAFPFGLIPFENLLDWIAPPPELSDNEIRPVFCEWDLFFTHIPGKLFIVLVFTAPAIITLFKHMRCEKGWSRFMLFAYIIIAVIALVEHSLLYISKEWYWHWLRKEGFTDLPTLSSDPAIQSIMPVFSIVFLITASLAQCLAFIVLVLGCYQRKILPRTALAAIFSVVIILGSVKMIGIMGGAENACGPGKIITVP